MTNPVEGTTETESPFTTTTTDHTTVTPVTPTIEYASNFVGEDKKFKDVQSALDSLPFADEHITNLETQIAALKAQTENSKTMDEYLKEIREVQPTASTPEPVATTPQEIDYSKVDGLVEAKFENYRKQGVVSANIKGVVDTLTEQYGSQEEAEKVYIAKAKELDLSMEDINKMAGDRPDLLLKLMGNPGKPTANPASGGLNTEALELNTQPDAPKKSVMGGASNAELMASWRAHKQT